MNIIQQQKCLGMLALYDAPIDGIVGTKTQTAINEFCELEGVDETSFVETLSSKINNLPIRTWRNAYELADLVKKLYQALYYDDVGMWAYTMATAEHETAETFQPVTEAFYLRQEQRERYLKRQRYYPYYGRGLVQLTWDFNYKKYDELLNIELFNNPDLVLDHEISLFILVHGLITGLFTGRRLNLYVNNGSRDFYNARRVVNGTDKASEIAELAEKWVKYYE